MYISSEINKKSFFLNFSKFIFSLILLSIFSFPVFASNFGSGTDGSVTLSTSVNINTQSLGSSSDLNGSTADGVVYRVSNISGSTITTAQNATGILANDLILLINLQGTASNYSSVGNYEILTVNSVSGTTVNLTSSVSLNYVNGDSYSNQKVIIQRIPQYSSLTINNGGVITASTFDSLGTLSSGIVAFAVNGNLTINSGGLINVAGKGFQGGAGISGTGTQGSSYNGNGSRTNTALGGGGGGGISHYYNNGITSGGGGGGYAIAGSNGIYGSGFATSAPGTGGGTYGNASLTKIYLGSGGGGGASYSDSSDSPGGNGANGGGVVLIMANSVNMVGGIYAIGNTGETGGNSWNAGGGGGAGGSIFIKCQSASLGSSNVIAYGGPGGAGRGGAGGGGAGGTGRIAVQYSSSVSGTTNPAATTNQIDITPPSFSSITNSSSTWYSSARNSVITASDSGGSGLAEIRYNWGSNTMNSACNSGGTVISSGGTTASSPVGNQTLYVCARDTAGNVTSTSQANYKWENTPPSTPTPATTSNSVSGYIKGSFTVDAPSGSSDTGGSGLASYSIWKCDDNLLTINCIVIASGISGSTVSISGSYLPSEGNSMYYYWRSIDSAGNTSGNSSPLGLTMDSTAPTTSVTIANSKYDSSNWVASNTINGTANDAVSTLNKVEITIQRNSDSTYWTGSSWGGLTWLSVIGTTTWTYPMDNLNLDENVTYEVKARATDIATNTTSTGLGVDTFLYELYIPPTPTPTNTPVPTDTPTPTPTNTPVPSNTPTPTPTETPVPTLTNTPVPTLSPIPGWSTIHNVNSGIVPVLITDWNTNLETTAQTGITTVGVEDTVNANIKVAEMPVNFGSSPDWSGVTGATDENIAYFHSTQSISTITNGAASSYSLYIRKGEGDKVLICPGATSLSEVTLTCFGGYYLSEGETKNGATATVITNGVQYWKVSGLTSTGGMSVLTGLKDILSRLQVSEPSDHKINFNTTNGMIVGSTDTMVLSFPDFDLSSIILNDIELTDSIGSARNLASSASDSTWGVIINSTAKTITFSVPTSGTGGYDAPSQIAIKIGINAGGTNQIVNPASVGNTSIGITLNNTAPGENGDVTIPIIDSDTITITAYVTAYLSFDIDTGVGEIPGVNPIINCEFDTCLTHQNGDPGTNYTVDLGELTSSVVNKSNDTSVAHSSGGNGIVNSIYFDISTNAPSGAVVAVTSANGGLKGPGVNKIPSIGIQAGADGIVRFDGDDIPANSGVYGYTLPVASSQVYGSIIKNTLCDSAFKYCGADTIIPKTVFTTNNLPVDTARVRLDLAAAANYTNNPGLYTDTLTFIATATF